MNASYWMVRCLCAGAGALEAMILVDNEGITRPQTNLALEEFVLRHLDADEDHLLFYINEPSIIIGRNQNTLEEINDDYVRRKGIHVVRRMSGGGAVYHDHGNLNFSFLTPYRTEKFNNFRQFNQPIIAELRALGIAAEMSGRNDMLVDGRKVSGNAQFVSGARMFSHGTLLFDSDLEEVTRALNVRMSKIESKGHKSVRSRVANLAEFLAPDSMTIESFRQRLVESICGRDGGLRSYRLTPADWAEVARLEAARYAQWDWNFGRSPDFNIQRRRRFDAGEIDLRLDVHEGRVEALTVYGDFLGSAPVEELAELLRGVRYEPGDLSRCLAEVDLGRYFGAIAREDFLGLVYGED